MYSTRRNSTIPSPARRASYITQPGVWKGGRAGNTARRDSSGSRSGTWNSSAQFSIRSAPTSLSSPALTTPADRAGRAAPRPAVPRRSARWRTRSVEYSILVERRKCQQLVDDRPVTRCQRTKLVRPKRSASVFSGSWKPCRSRGRLAPDLIVAHNLRVHHRCAPTGPDLCQSSAKRAEPMRSAASRCIVGVTWL